MSNKTKTNILPSYTYLKYPKTGAFPAHGVRLPTLVTQWEKTSTTILEDFTIKPINEVCIEGYETHENIPADGILTRSYKTVNAYVVYCEGSQWDIRTPMDVSGVGTKSKPWKNISWALHVLDCVLSAFNTTELPCGCCEMPYIILKVSGTVDYTVSPRNRNGDTHTGHYYNHLIIEGIDVNITDSMNSSYSYGVYNLKGVHLYNCKVIYNTTTGVGVTGYLIDGCCYNCTCEVSSNDIAEGFVVRESYDRCFDKVIGCLENCSAVVSGSKVRGFRSRESILCVLGCSASCIASNECIAFSCSGSYLAGVSASISTTTPYNDISCFRSMYIIGGTAHILNTGYDTYMDYGNASFVIGAVFNVNSETYGVAIGPSGNFYINDCVSTITFATTGAVAGLVSGDVVRNAKGHVDGDAYGYCCSGDYIYDSVFSMRGGDGSSVVGVSGYLIKNCSCTLSAINARAGYLFSARDVIDCTGTATSIANRRISKAEAHGIMDAQSISGCSINLTAVHVATGEIPTYPSYDYGWDVFTDGWFSSCHVDCPFGATMSIGGYGNFRKFYEEDIWEGCTYCVSEAVTIP